VRLERLLDPGIPALRAGNPLRLCRRVMLVTRLALRLGRMGDVTRVFAERICRTATILRSGCCARADQRKIDGRRQISAQASRRPPLDISPHRSAIPGERVAVMAPSAPPPSDKFAKHPPLPSPDRQRLDSEPSFIKARSAGNLSSHGPVLA